MIKTINNPLRVHTYSKLFMLDMQNQIPVQNCQYLKYPKVQDLRV